LSTEALPAGRVQRFAILAEGRSGSNWLVSLLAAHPACYCHGELFLPSFPRARDGLSNLAFLEQQMASGAAQAGKTHVGFKHLATFDPAVAAAVAADPRYKVIFLRRRDRLAQYASLLIARRTEAWVARAGDGGPPGQPRVTFEVRGFMDHCRAAEGAFKAERALLRAAGRGALELTYEELEAGTGLGRVLDFLGLPARGDLRSPLRRQNSPRTLERFDNPWRARLLAPLVAWRPSRKLLRILRGIRPLRRLLD
jgi:LPS sulfotransferase NodH